MKRFWKYGGYLLGIVLLTSFFFPHLFFPAGIAFATLGIFTQVCSKNTSGASRIFIAEKAVATAFTVSSHEITAVTGTTPFMRVDIVQDSLQWSEEVTPIGLNNLKVANKIEFDIQAPATLTNTFRQALMDASPCGLFAIIVDSNGCAWFPGHNEVDIRERPLRYGGDKHDTGKGLGDAQGNLIHIILTNECSGLALKADATLNAAIVTTANSTIIKWS
jgi:hypothetical protein